MKLITVLHEGYFDYLLPLSLADWIEDTSDALLASAPSFESFVSSEKRRDINNFFNNKKIY